MKQQEKAKRKKYRLRILVSFYFLLVSSKVSPSVLLVSLSLSKAVLVQHLIRVFRSFNFLFNINSYILLFHRGTPSLSISRAILLSCFLSSRKSSIDRISDDITTIYFVSASITISIILCFISLVSPSIIIARSTSESGSKSPRAFEPKR